MVDKLYFYNRSRDVYPGKSTNEEVATPEQYDRLSQIPEWRKILSNFSDDCEIEHAGLTYRTSAQIIQEARYRSRQHS